MHETFFIEFLYVLVKLSTHRNCFCSNFYSHSPLKELDSALNWDVFLTDAKVISCWKGL
jgi:hypothetical protein